MRTLNAYISFQAILFVAAITVGHAGEAGPCRENFLPPNGSSSSASDTVRRNIEVTTRLRSSAPAQMSASAELSQLMKSVRTEVYDKSVALEGKVRSEAVSNRVYDVVVVGAGPHGSAVAAEILFTDPSARVLLLDASEGDLGAGVFSTLGDSFRINSSETAETSGNNFPGVPVQASDLNLNGEKYVSAQVIGDLTSTIHYASNLPIIFRQKVQPIEKASPNDPARYVIVTNTGLRVFANRVVLATGLGQATFKINDSQTHNLYLEEKAKQRAGQLPGIEVVDDVLARANRAHLQGQDLRRQYEGKKVAIIGAGDGGNIAADFLLGISNFLHKDPAVRGPESILWVGQKPTAAQFVSNIPEYKRDRYEAIGDSFGSLIDPKSARLTGVERVTVNGSQQFKLTYRFADGRVENRLVDHVIVCTGYENLVPEFMANLPSNTTSEITGNPRMFSFFPSFGRVQPIARRVDGEHIYVAGIAAGLTSMMDVINQYEGIGGYLDVLLPYSRTLGNQLAKEIRSTRASAVPADYVAAGSRYDSYMTDTPPPQLGPRTAHYSLKRGITAAQRPGLIAFRSEGNRATTFAATKVRVKMLVGKMLLNNPIYFSRIKDVILEVRPTGEFFLRTRQGDIFTQDSVSHLNGLLNDPEISDALSELFTFVSTPIQFEFLVDQDGRSRLGTLELVDGR